MDVAFIPTLIGQFSELFEGTHGKQSWVVDGPADSAVFGTIDQLTPAQALAAPVPGARSVAEHIAHLHFALALACERMQGKNPPAPWETSFQLADPTPAGWDALKQTLRQVYQQMTGIMNENRDRPLPDWPGLHLAGLTGTVAHTAYHLGAIRQIAKVVTASR